MAKICTYIALRCSISFKQIPRTIHDFIIVPDFCKFFIQEPLHSRLDGDAIW